MNHYCDMVLPAVYRRGDLFDLEVLEWQDLVLEEASQQKEVDREKDRLYNFDTSKVYNVSMHEILELRKTVREEKEVLPVKVSVSELKNPWKNWIWKSFTFCQPRRNRTKSRYHPLWEAERKKEKMPVLPMELSGIRLWHFWIFPMWHHAGRYENRWNRLYRLVM